MYQGGTQFETQTGKIIRTAGLIIPVLLTAYGLMNRSNGVDVANYLSDSVFLSLMSAWIIFGLFQYVFPPHSLKSIGIRLAVYHVLAAGYILSVSGFSSPVIFAWPLLFLGMYGFFSLRGLYISICALVAVAILDSILLRSDEAGLIANVSTLSVMLAIIGMGLAIGKAQATDSKELEKSKELETLQQNRILTIVNNLADAVLSTNKHGVIEVYNAASLNLLDTNSGLNGKRLSTVLSLVDQQGNPVNLAAELKKARSVVVRDDLSMTVSDETLRLEVTYSPIRSSYAGDDQVSDDGYIIILRDVTKSKSLEEERDEFISVVSHELRTPITIAEGTISNVQLMMDRPDIAKDKLTSGITVAHDQIVYLAKMVNDLSTLSRAERGVADEPEEIHVRTVINDIFNEYAPRAEKKGLHFNLDMHGSIGSIMTSRLYFKELLQNFVTNAIKYTKEGSVTLHVQRTDDIITFSVKDTGIGISKTDQTNIFKKFYRSEDYRTRETGGTGLGLYVATKLARKIGTNIELVSRLNHGSTFSFSLPAAQDNENQ